RLLILQDGKGTMSGITILTTYQGTLNLNLSMKQNYMLVIRVLAVAVIEMTTSIRRKITDIHIIRAEGHLATMEHSQGQKDSREAPTGARLLQFLSERQKLGAKAMIEQTKKELYSNLEQVTKLREIINQELKDHMIEEVSDNQVLFYNPIFWVPKKKGKRRKIIDCQEFNRQILVESFKMEVVRETKDLFLQGDYTTSLYLLQEYHHIAVSIQIRLFLAYYFEKKSYWYRGMPFGVAVAPRIFAKTLKIAITEIRKQWKEIRIIVYSDDILLLHKQSAVLQNATHQFLG
ncbi:MAG: hypothetical protein EZS28_022243, partial [Streblomastix strix]